jgi:hypothetical protein
MAKKGGTIIFEKGIGRVKNHTEISDIFRIFLEKYPDAERYATDLVIPSWTKKQQELKARAYKFVPNHMVPFLFEIWEIKLSMILSQVPAR